VAVTIRRLHDLDRKWQWFLIVFTGIGAIVLLVWFCLRGTIGPNRYGDDPLGAGAASGVAAPMGAGARKGRRLVVPAVLLCVIAGAAYIGYSAYRAIAAGAFCSHCVQVNNGGPMIQGSGHPATESRTVSPFTAVRVDSGADVVIDRTGTQTLSVTADDNLVSFLTAEVRDGTLYLAYAPDKSFQTSNLPLYHITIADLRAVEVRGSGDVKAEHLDSPALSVTLAGSADVSLVGRADDLSLTINGSGNLDAGGLAAKRAKVVMSGSGDATVNAGDTLDVQLSGSGDVEYLGSPKLTKDVRGSGSVSHK
jgi:hypothetical protein